MIQGSPLQISSVPALLRKRNLWWGCFLCGWVLILAGTTGCKKKVPPNKLALQLPIQFDSMTQKLLKQWKLDAGEFQKVLKNKVKTSHWLHVVGRGGLKPGMYQMMVRLSFMTVPPRFIHKRMQSKGRRFALARVLMQLKTKPRSASYGIREFALLPYLPSHPPTAVQVQATLRRAWNKGVASLELWGQLYHQTSRTLRILLTKSKNMTAIRHSIVLLGRRRDKAAVMPIVKHLKTNNRFVVLAAVAALTRLKDQRAAAPLIKAARGRSIAFQAQVLSALGEIGGPQAISHLYTLSTAHPNRLIRRTAKEAFEEIQQRGKKVKSRSKVVGRTP